jgi:3-hydroxy-3-methylglutaryl CoA synthase
MASIHSYGAYLPRPRVNVKDIHSFFGRPGRPRARTLSTPGLDEDPLTMAYEAARAALGGSGPAGSVVSVSQSAPVGMRKMSATLAEALRLSQDVTTVDLAGHPGGLLDALELGGLLATRTGQPSVVVATDHVVSYEERVADTLSAGGATAFVVGEEGGFAELGDIARHRDEVFDVWVLGREPEPRYRLEVLAQSYAHAAQHALAGLEKLTERPASDYKLAAVSQPHPQPLRALGRLGITKDALEPTTFVGEIGNLGAASLGFSLALGFDNARKGQRILAFGYGSGEGIAQDIEITDTVPKIGAVDQVPGDEIAIGTYYRWTRGRQAEPH